MPPNSPFKVFAEAQPAHLDSCLPCVASITRCSAPASLHASFHQNLTQDAPGASCWTIVRQSGRHHGLERLKKFSAVLNIISAGHSSLPDLPGPALLGGPTPTCRRVRATSVSMTGPLSSFSRCTSSMIRSLTRDATATSPPLRVITSHFSGVVTIICVSASSLLLSCMSPADI